MPSIVIPAPFTGSVWQHSVSVDQQVQAGTDLMTLEACKLEYPVQAPADGRVVWLRSMGEMFQEGEAVAIIETD